MNATLGLCVDPNAVGFKARQMGIPAVLDKALGVQKPWVARIRGLDLRYELEREFVDPKTDYSDADKKGRGAKHWFILEPGVYEAFEPLKRGERRFFLRVDAEGGVAEISAEEARMGLEHRFKFADQLEVYRQLAGLAAGEGMDLSPTLRPVLWQALMSRREILAAHGMQTRGKRKRHVQVFVRPEYRGKGVGRLCLDQLELFADYSHLILEGKTRLPEPLLARGWDVAKEHKNHVLVERRPQCPPFLGR
jgi:GNAT superfamily N-acetyltransferase